MYHHLHLVIEKGDYIGLGLLDSIDPDWISTVRLNVVLESFETLLPNLILEVSENGYQWVRYRYRSQSYCLVRRAIADTPA